jgi:hypothetical protein
MKRGDFADGKGKGNMNSNPYSRGYGNNYAADSGTYVPGMHEEAVSSQDESKNEDNSAPVVGFLYSISRQGIGEYWPLRLGTNVIGRASDCDIRLMERSVSEHHASISIKQMSSTHRLIASIRDIGSKNGMYLNDEELDYDNHSCKANDIITIGKCYKLIMLLVDAEQLGLSVAEDFVSVEDNSFQPNTFGKYSSMDNPYSANERKVESGTVDLSGDQFDGPGNTSFL